jgi:tartrate dehydratase beta subunit/fumarate hydratase class I family protein
MSLGGLLAGDLALQQDLCNAVAERDRCHAEIDDIAAEIVARIPLDVRSQLIVHNGPCCKLACTRLDDTAQGLCQ